MKEFKRENKNKIWFSPVFLLLFFCFVVFFAYNIFGLIKKEREISHRKDLILDEIKELKERELTLTENIKNLETEKGKEAVIRDKYQVVKQGEKMVVIVDRENPETEVVQEKMEHSFWDWVKELFSQK